MNTHQAWRVVVILMLACVLISLTIGFTISRVIGHYEVTPSVPSKRTHLPTKCRPHYNLGTQAWPECMGVGRK